MEKIVKILEKVAWVATVVFRFVKTLVGADSDSKPDDGPDQNPGPDPDEGGETA